MKTLTEEAGRGVDAGWRIRRADGLRLLEAATFARQAWLIHGFTTRPGGASMLDGARALNLGFTEWDTRAAVLANRAKLLGVLEAEELRLVTLRQIHSDVVHALEAAPAQAARGDALVTRAPGLLLAVQTADCVPILLADLRRRAVAAIHAGWRGTLKRIAAKTLGRMRMLFDTRPRDVVAALGPGIGRCCYEVGPEVVQAFAAQFAEAAGWFASPDAGPHETTASFDALAAGDAPNPLQWLSMAPPGRNPPPPRLKLDLAAANRWQLREAGVPEKHIVVSTLCTACSERMFFSHRRDHGRTGRLMGVIGIRG